ncbi:hypothetical protein DPMN_100320 [Dreissena polymorpha]|uniref:Uncharacterized protein n=1 Tax=Dreissena polymorpha TaxID=45954 RepID=A0A9D4LFQ9_DREPO|nr:hypothetical protein DPMN_100320 [Dreissena polymorpha]
MEISRNRELELENSMLRRELHNLQLENEKKRMQHEIDETIIRLEMLASTPFKTDIERGRPEVYSLRDGINSEKKMSSTTPMLGSSPKPRRLLPKTPVVGASRMDMACQTEQIKDNRLDRFVNKRKPESHMSDREPAGPTSKDEPPTTSKHGVKVKPATYDGIGAWADYKAHFEAITKFNVWDSG